MRLLILAAVTALSLAACKNNAQQGSTTNADDNLTAEAIVANDVTAIDAVTGDAANMAADVNYTAADNAVDSASNSTSSATGTHSTRQPAGRTRPVTRESTAPSNAAAASTTPPPTANAQ